MELSYIQIETIIIYIVAILVVALVIFVTMRVLFKVAFSVTLISTINREKIFQNLDNWTGNIFWYGFLISLGVTLVLESQSLLHFTLAMGLILYALWSYLGGFSSLNHEMQKAFNEKTGWFEKTYKVESIYLDKQTYKIQVTKIKEELQKAKASGEQYTKLENELLEVMGIIDNINEIYRKSLKNLTTISKNKELLLKLYEELKNRHKYYEEKYHLLLMKNYDCQRTTEQMKQTDETIHTQKQYFNDL